MSGSETGAAVMTTTEPFTIGVASPPATQTMRVAYGADGTAVYKSVAGSSPTYQSAASGGGGGAPEVPSAGTNVPYGLNMNVGEPVKKKRGRPRKYGADGTMALALMPARPAAASPAASAAPQSAGTFSPPSGTPPSGAPPSAFSGGTGSASSLKKARGRPPGSSKKQQMEALGSAGFGFTPHVINVKAGEDVSSKIMSFSQNGPRAICILSANGAISNVTLRQAATSGGTATYEGRFEILSLCGSFLLTEVAGQRSRTGGLSVSLAGPDGRVLGGCVAGFLTAASPVQVIVGSFIPEGRKESKPVNHMEPLSSTPMLFSGGGAPVVSSPPSHGTLSESSGGGGSPLNHSSGACNNNNPQGGMLGMPWR